MKQRTNNVPSNERPFNEIRDTGLLWLINRTVFHPRGYALFLHYEDRENPLAPGGVATGWGLMGDGSEPWKFGDPPEEALALGAKTEDELFQMVKELLK